MAGRVGCGERWQFRELSYETCLRLNNRLVYLDRFRLPNGLERSARVMAECSYVGTGLVVGRRASSIASVLHEAAPEAGIDIVNNEVAALRIVSAEGPELHRVYDIFRQHSRIESAFAN